MREIKKNPGAQSRQEEIEGNYIQSLYRGDFYELSGELVMFEEKNALGWYVFKKVNYDWFDGNIAYVTKNRIYRKEKHLEFIKKSRDITPWTIILMQDEKTDKFVQVDNKIVRW